VFQKIFSELKKNDLSFYCLLFVLTAAVGGGFVFNIPLQILCLFVLLACFSFLFVNKSFESKDIFIVLLPLIAIFISYLGADFQTNVRTASLGFLNAVLAFFIASYSNARNKENILTALIIFAAWVSFLLFVQALSQTAQTENAMLLNVNIAAGFLTLTYPLCFSFVEKSRHPLVFLLIALLIFAAVIITKSRSAIIIIYLASLFYFIKLRKKTSLRMFFAVILFLTLAGIIYSFKAKIGGQSLEDRLVWQETAFLMFKDYPVFGVGFGNFSALFAYYRPELVLNTLFTHNIVFQLLSETGFVGFLCFAAAGFVIFKKIVKHAANSAFAISILSFILLNLGDYSFFIPANLTAFFIICAAALNVKTRLRDRKADAVFVIIPAAVLAYIFFNVLIADNYFKQGNVLNGVKNFNGAKGKYLKALKYDNKNPNYWHILYENELSAGNYKEALEYLLTAEKYYRYSSQIKSDALYLYKILDDKENAAKYAKLAREYDKFNPFYMK
jgi:O-antigen ligase